MKHQLLYLAVLLLTLPNVVNAQSGNGKVVDAVTGNPLAGASIAIGGKAITNSDKEGAFNFNCNGATEIAVSFVGYETVKKMVADCDQAFTVTLKPLSLYLDQVEITATSNPNKQILFQPASIAKLSTTELKRGSGVFLDDAINTNIPGVVMQRRTVAAGQSFNIRGYGNGARGTNGVSSNFDGQGYKLYLNGIPITDAEGITLMDDIDFNSVGNVEVIKGPVGTLYGLAIAGVVNLKIVKPEKGKVSLGQDILIGNYGLQRYTTHFQMGGKNSSLLVNYGKQKSDGFMAHTNSDKDFINIAGEFQPNEKENITVYGGYSNSYDQRGGELTITQYNNGDYSGNPAYIKNNAHSNIISFRLGVGHTYNFNSHIANTTTVFGSGVSNNVSSAGGWTDKAPINFGLRSTFDTKFSLNNSVTLSGITGVETQHQYAQITGYPMIKNLLDTNGYNIIGAIRSNQVITTGTTSVFTEWTLGLPGDFSITAGAGLSNMHITLNDRFYVMNSTKPTEYKATYDGLFSPHVAINKVFNKDLSLYASYSKGYKAPVSSYFYIPFTGEVNKDLKPEIGNQYELGSKGAVFNSRLAYELAVFYTKFTDKMTAVAVPVQGNPSATAYSYMVNGGGQDNKGLELVMKYTAFQSSNNFFSIVRPFFNLAYSDFKYDDFGIQKSATVTEDYSGKAVAGVAKFTANVGVDVFTKVGLYGNMYYSYKDGLPISSDGLNKASSFNLLNAKIGLKRSIGTHFDFDVFFGVNNITGTQYYYMVFVNQLPDAYLPAPKEANYFGGININYNF
jgi:iron complex outermembrane receptor protein